VPVSQRPCEQAADTSAHMVLTPVRCCTSTGNPHLALLPHFAARLLHEPHHLEVVHAHSLLQVPQRHRHRRSMDDMGHTTRRP
jgi:hypothetical protein